MYREFCYDGAEHFSVMNLPGMEQHAVLLDSVSKRYSACGVRIGALISRNRELMDTALRFAQARLSPPTLGQVAAEAAIDTPPAYFKKVRDEYTRRRNLVTKELNRMAGVRCPVPKGAFYVVAQLPIDDGDRFCRWLLESFEHEGQTVMLAPAGGFYFSEGAGKNEVRIAYVLNEEALGKAMLCLSQALAVYPERTQ